MGELVKAALPQVYIKCADTEVNGPETTKGATATGLCKRSGFVVHRVARDMHRNISPSEEIKILPREINR